MLKQVVSMMPIFLVSDGTETNFSLDLTSIQFTWPNSTQTFPLPFGTTFDAIVNATCTYQYWSQFFGWLQPPNLTTVLSGNTISYTFDSPPMAYDSTSGISPLAYYIVVCADLAVTLP
jgi:hypothetical protein